MKVKIIGSSIKSRWYSGNIGETFEVSNTPTSDYYSVKNSSKVIFKEDCQPLKSAVAARSASTNIDYAATLWKELRRRNGGTFPARQDWVAVTKERLNAALKAAQHCA